MCNCVNLIVAQFNFEKVVNLNLFQLPWKIISA